VQRWAALAREAAGQASASGLSRVEDEVDAFVCAYMALFFWTHGGTNTGLTMKSRPQRHGNACWLTRRSARARVTWIALSRAVSE
jgi:hypothetical protein